MSFGGLRIIWCGVVDVSTMQIQQTQLEALTHLTVGHHHIGTDEHSDDSALVSGSASKTGVGADCVND